MNIVMFSVNKRVHFFFSRPISVFLIGMFSLFSIMHFWTVRTKSSILLFFSSVSCLFFFSSFGYVEYFKGSALSALLAY
jgi:hypothetical protein